MRVLDVRSNRAPSVVTVMRSRLAPEAFASLTAVVERERLRPLYVRCTGFTPLLSFTDSSLAFLGFTPSLAQHFSSLADGLFPARVASINRGFASVLVDRGPALSAIVRAHDEAPVVGDWVAVRAVHDARIVESIAPRSSHFARKAAGRAAEAQTLAANVDTLFVVTAVGGDFNPARLVRYVAAARSGGVEAVVVVNKSDRPHDRDAMVREVARVMPTVSVAFTRAEHEESIDELAPWTSEGRTVALVGSSGVGKSSLTRLLADDGSLVVQRVRAHDEKGQHTTTSSMLRVGLGGVLVIDTPGLRELGLWDAEEGVDDVFSDVLALAEQCRFRDCAHNTEPGCAVRAAIASGEIDEARLRQHRALSQESAAVSKRARDKAWGKSVAKSLRAQAKLRGR